MAGGLKNFFGKNEPMSFLEHLEALRWHILRSVLVLTAVTSVLFFYSNFIFDKVLFGPTHPDFVTYRALCKLSRLLHLGSTLCLENKVQFKLVNTEIWGQLTMYMWGTIVAGLIITVPYILWEIWRFVGPALKPNEIRPVRGFVFAASGLFMLGAAFGYYIIVPWTINFLNDFQISHTQIDNLLNINSYISTVTSLVLWMGIIFELPVLTYLLTSIGVISSSFLKNYRKHAIVAVLIVAALIAPPDVASQVFVSIPLYLLFEVSIFVSKYIERKKIIKAT